MGKEISTAASVGTLIIPLRFETDLPNKAEQWPCATTPKAKLMVERAQEALQTNSIPPRGRFFDSLDDNVWQLLQQISFAIGKEIERKSAFHVSGWHVMPYLWRWSGEDRKVKYEEEEEEDEEIEGEDKVDKEEIEEEEERGEK